MYFEELEAEVNFAPFHLDTFLRYKYAAKFIDEDKTGEMTEIITHCIDVHHSSNLNCCIIAYFDARLTKQRPFLLRRDESCHPPL